MSDKNLARRTSIQIFFAGVDITSEIEKYGPTITYTDNEEDEADDLQIQLPDADGIWLESWLNQALDAAAELESNDSTVEGSGPKITGYKVTATGGLSVRSSPGDQYFQYGTLAYGTVISVASISGGWANFTYSGKNAYCKSAYLQAIYSGGTSSTSSGTASVSGSSSGGWTIGDDVIVTGRAQYSSTGAGTPGIYVTNYTGKITHLNLKNGIAYPIHVGQIGWFAESEVQKVGAVDETPARPEEKTARKGLRIQAVIARQNWESDGVDDILECGQFELDSVVAQGPPGKITIKATALPYSSSIRQAEKSKSWENYNLNGIAAEIASENGMACMYLSSLNPQYGRVEQYKTSDIAFLQKLCHDVGCSLKASNNIIVIFDQSEYEKETEVRTVKKGSGYTKYKLSTGSTNTYSRCIVSYTTTKGNVITGTAIASENGKKKDDGQVLRIHQRVSSQADAEKLASKMLRLHNKYEKSAQFTFPGDPSLLAGRTMLLEDWGAFDGKYIVKKAQHKNDQNGYTTQVDLRCAPEIVEEEPEETEEIVVIAVGDLVMCNDGVVKYSSGAYMPSWVPKTPLYVRAIEQNGNVLLVSTEKTSSSYTGRVWATDVHKV